MRGARRAALAETIDVTLPVRSSPAERGRIHPISQVIDEITAIFADMGFSVAEGPDIETDYLQFHRAELPRGPSGPRDARHLLLQADETASARCCARIPRRCRSAPC
jgi:phenylalanyl-tRNA synthetase alpha chain